MALLRRITTLTLSAPLIYTLIEPHRLVVRRFEVTFKNLPAAVEGLRIAQLSDLHFSAITALRQVRRAVDLCNAQKPDVIVLTGDYVSRRDSYSRLTLARLWARPETAYAAEVVTELRRLSAPQGVFAVLGNHDHLGNGAKIMAELLSDAGIITLINSSRRVRDVLPIIGLDDLRVGRPLVQAACAGVAPDEAQVALSHNPRLLPLLAERNCLILAGHTHGGQVRLPLTSFRYRPADMRGTRLNRGWYQQDQACLYINPGLGSVHFPMRFRCPPEITVFTLRARPWCRT